MFSNIFLKSFRILLLPFSLIYGLGIIFRNALYNLNILGSTSFGLPIICIGNLSVGGTGKSPMVELLVEKLQHEFNPATLSRGYKRKTKGYALANEGSTALEIGDEPMQFHLKFPNVAIAVGEKRLEAIPQLLHDRPETNLIILDDAFQHRAIRAGLNILLTEYDNLFTHDFFLPTGDLRDQKSSSKRADIIIITKCDPGLTIEEREKLLMDIKGRPHQQTFFTSFEYGALYHIINKTQTHLYNGREILLVSGIANPKPLKKHLENCCSGYQMIHYSDHHIYTIDDLKEIKKRFEKMDSTDKIILTTEKDSVRLLKFNKEMTELPLYILPVRHHFLFDDEQRFMSIIRNFVRDFKMVN
jgi:tetraacyldisaccharide 4'-kinase